MLVLFDIQTLKKSVLIGSNYLEMLELLDMNFERVCIVG